MNTSHVVPAIIRKLTQAVKNQDKNINLWGTGKPLREFMHVDDLASAAIFVMKLNFDKLYREGFTHLNVGTQEEVSVNNLSKFISDIIGFSGNILFDDSKPDGTPRKIMNSTKLYNLGWSPVFL